MAEKRKGQNGSLGAKLRSFLPEPRLLVILLICLTTISAVLVYFHLVLERTIVVDARTGAFEIELEAELAGKVFRNVWICEKPEDGAAQETVSQGPIGCPSLTHRLVGPEAKVAPTLPVGSELEFTAQPGLLRIDVVSLPERYRDTDVGRLEGGALALVGREALEAFGTLALSGTAKIGALFSETDRVSTASGSYQIRGYTPVGLISGEMRELRSGKLLGGARVRFVKDDDETATAHIAVTLAEPDRSLMRVTAISGHATSNIAVRYYFTEEVIIRPSFFDALILDPAVQLFAMIFGAIAGYGWLKRLSKGTRAGQDR